MKWYFGAFKKWADFSGRARRKEFWLFHIFNIAFILIMNFIDTSLGLRLEMGFGFLTAIYLLIMIVPSITVYIRRIHDTGRSGWCILVGFVPLIGGVFLLAFTIFDSEPGTNQYGPNPKNSILDNMTSEDPFMIKPKEP